MKKYGAELRQEILEEKKRMQESIADRTQRVLNCETDWDDCFVSQHFEERGIYKCDLELKILDGDGTKEWEVILDENGEEVRVNHFRNKWGGRSVVGRGVFASTIDALLKKTGWTREMIRVPVWVKFVSHGNGLAGAYCGDYQVVRWHTNMVTGEYVGFPD